MSAGVASPVNLPPLVTLPLPDDSLVARETDLDGVRGKIQTVLAIARTDAESNHVYSPAHADGMSIGGIR